MASRDPQRTRTRLLDAGLATLQEEPADRLFERLEARPITARAGLSVGTFYDHFNGPDEYVAALLEYSLAKAENPAFAVARAAFQDAVDQGADFGSATAAGARAALASQDRNATFALQMAVWTKAGRDRALAGRLRRTYELAVRESATFYTELMAVLELEPRPPFTVEQLAVAIIALFEGFTLRRGVGLRDDDVFADLVLAVIVATTRRRGDDIDADEFLASHLPTRPGE